MHVIFFIDSYYIEDMRILSIIKKWFFALLFLTFFVWLFVFNWSFIFKKKVVGEVVAVERIMGTVAIVTSQKNDINPQAFSFSVGIKDRFSGEIFMASSEDRKWAAVSKGNCVIAAYFPYPPWRILDKGMTDHNARLLRNFTDCTQLENGEGILDKIKFFVMAE